MRRYLFAWEMGVGLGHLGKILPLANALHERGHQVSAVVKNLADVPLVMGKTYEFAVMPSPIGVSPCRKTFRSTSTYTQLLHNVGFGDLNYLESKVRAWLEIFSALKPDAIICDHSPIAQLAARIIGYPTILIGTGFTCPPTIPSLPPLDQRNMPDTEVRKQQTAVLLGHCNQVLQGHQGPALARLADLYGQVAATFLLTHEELDHFAGRVNPTYWGSWDFLQGVMPSFPQGLGPKVFGYLKPSLGTEAILSQLRQQGWPALIVGTHFTQDFMSRYSSATLQITNRPVNIEAAAQWCDFAILNATHASVAVVLRAGKPVLCLPQQMEQYLLAQRVATQKLGWAVAVRSALAYDQGLKIMVERFREFAINSRKFAARYKSYDPQATLTAIADRIEQY